MLHKRADKSGDREPGAAWPVSHVELLSEVPDEWAFSEQFVKQGVAEGWITYRGDGVDYEVHPDPLGAMGNSGEITLKLPGDTLVLSLVKDGEPVEVAYLILVPPVPVGYRAVDESEPLGLRANHDFKCEAVK
jgi:hypothetical protein